MDERDRRRLEGLLELADPARNCDAEEANAAARVVFEILRRTFDDIGRESSPLRPQKALPQDPDQIAVEVLRTFSHQPPLWQTKLFATVCEISGCKAALSDLLELKVIGKAADRKEVKRLYFPLVERIEEVARESAPVNATRDWLRSFEHGAAHEIAMWFFAEGCKVCNQEAEAWFRRHVRHHPENFSADYKDDAAGRTAGKAAIKRSFMTSSEGGEPQ